MSALRRLTATERVGLHYLTVGAAIIAVATVSAAAIGYVTLTVAARVIAAVEPE